MHEIDLRSLLVDHADRNGSPFIDREAFFKELSTQALYRAQKDRKWEVWTEHPREKFDSELNALIKAGICSIQKNSGIVYVYMPLFFVERIRALWLDIENQEKFCFPNDSNLKVAPPKELLHTFVCEDLIKQLREPQKGDLPIIMITFSSGMGHTYILSSFTESRLLDAAVAKMRVFLRGSENKTQCLGRIRGVLPDNAMQTGLVIETILKNPISCVTMMRDGDASSFEIWNRICQFVKDTVRPENTQMSDADRAARQGAEIIDVYRRFFQELAEERYERENILRDIYDHMTDPPYFWTFNMIYRIHTIKGKPAIELIHHDEINNYILKRSYDTGDSFVQPPLLVFYDEFKEKCFARKETVFPGFSALIASSRKAVSDMLHKRWYRILRGYNIEAAMKSDLMFETLLIKVLKRVKPFVLILYQDTKLILLRKEFSAQESVSEHEKFFRGVDLKPLALLYNLDRKSIMQDVKLSLPFWYSISILFSIIRFFKGRSEMLAGDDIDADS